MRSLMQRVIRYDYGSRVQTSGHAQIDSARATGTRSSLIALTRLLWEHSAPRRALLRIRLLVAGVVGRHGSGGRRVGAARLIHIPARWFGGPGARDRVAVISHASCRGPVSIAALSCAARLRKRFTRHTERSGGDTCHDDRQNCPVHIGSPLERRRIAPRHRHIRDLRGSGCTSRRNGLRGCTSGSTVTSRYQSRLPVSPVNENRP
jgi:hypothetical protein